MFRRSYFYISSGQVLSIRTLPLTWRNVARKIYPLWRNWKIGSSWLIEWLFAALSKEPNSAFRITLVANCTGKCFEFDEAKSGWHHGSGPVFPFKYRRTVFETGLVRFEIFQSLVEPQMEERERQEEKRKTRCTLDLLRKRSTFSATYGSSSIDMQDPLVKQRKFLEAQIYRTPVILILDTSKVFPC